MQLKELRVNVLLARLQHGHCSVLSQKKSVDRLDW